MATGRVPTTANSPLTAKGDLFGYSTTQARVAVGNDGETLVADSSTATGLRYTGNYAAGKNRIINGDFKINQRGNTSITATNYIFDRFNNVISGGTGTATVTSQVFTPGAAPVAGYEGSNYLRIVTTSQSATSTITRFQQPIEDVGTFAGQTATISFWAKAATGTPSVALELSQNYGSGGSPSTQINIVGGTVPITTSWARYSITVAVPSISGKTLGTTANTSYLEMRLWVSAGSDFNARTGSLGIQSNTFEFWGIQAEAGSVATPFQTATGTIQGELAACQRYYYRNVTGTTSYNYVGIGGSGVGKSTTVALVDSPNPVTMRTPPSSVDFSNIALYDGTNLTNVTAVSLANGTASPSHCMAEYTVASGLTQYRPYVLFSSTTAGYVGFSAEL